MDIELAGRTGCCLCEEARDTLVALGLEFRWVDVDQDPELHRRFTHRVPVLLVDGKVVAEGRIGAAAVVKAIAR